MTLFVLLTFSVVLVSAVPSLNLKSPEWLAFKSKHGKVYKNAGEEAIRLATFAENSLLVNRHNERFAKGLETYQLGTNEHSDIPHAEFIGTRTGLGKVSKSNVNYCDFKYPTTTPATTTITAPLTTSTSTTSTTTKPITTPQPTTTTTTTTPQPTTTTTTTTTPQPTTTTTTTPQPTTTTTTTTTTTPQPTTTTTTTTPQPTTTTTTSTTSTTTVSPIGAIVDWRTKGAVTDVKNQVACSACWAFSAAGALESNYFLKTGKLVTLSEQNLIDCANYTLYYNSGCSGGWMGGAYDYIIANNGVDTMASYPYQAVQGTCAYDAANVGATCSNYTQIPYLDETALAEAVRTVGPVAVGISAKHYSFYLYKSGVYNNPNAGYAYINHAGVLVGYGTDPATGQDYWIVKNSWGTSWGMDGYILIARTQNNFCGITTYAMYPVI